MSVPIMSLSSVAAATLYFSGRLYATIWNVATSDSQQQALNDATRIINRFAWKGYLTDGTQDNSWPRSGVIFDYLAVDSTTVPEQILEAQYEIAFALLKGYDPERDMRGAGAVSRGYSSVRVAYDPKLTSNFMRWGVPSGAAWNLMLPFLDIEASEEIKIHRVS